MDILYPLGVLWVRASAKRGFPYIVRTTWNRALDAAAKISFQALLLLDLLAELPQRRVVVGAVLQQEVARGAEGGGGAAQLGHVTLLVVGAPASRAAGPRVGRSERLYHSNR